MINRRNFLKTTTAAGAAVVLPLSFATPVKQASEIYYVSTQSNDCQIDAKGDGTDLVRVPMIFRDREREWDFMRAVEDSIEADENMSYPMKVWFIYGPRNLVSKVAVAKATWPEARLLIAGQPMTKRDVVKSLSFSDLRELPSEMEMWRRVAMENNVCIMTAQQKRRPHA